MKYSYGYYAPTFENLKVLVRGRPIDTYSKDGKTYIEGRKGTNYTIKYTNNSYKRQKVVISVDGINIITGKADWSEGYVVNGYGSIEIPGWRKDSGNVAKFEFSSISESYNQRTDGHDEINVGVIGCLIFDEKEALIAYRSLPRQDIWHHHVWDHSTPLNISPTIWNYNSGVGQAYGAINSIGPNNASDNIACATSFTSSMNQCVVDSTPQEVGTGYGSNASFETTSVYASWESTARATYSIYYDSAEGLRRKGIYVNRTQRKEPDPFPGYNPNGVPFPVR